MNANETGSSLSSGSSSNTPTESDHKLRDSVEDVLHEHPSLRVVKRVVVSVIGGTVLLIGILLLVLPGPAFIVIPAGLGVLALEFRWARRWLRKAKSLISRDREE